MGAGTHEGDRILGLDHAGDDDERNVRLNLAEDVEGRRYAEVRQVEVAKDDIPRASGQGRTKATRCFHPLMHDIEAAAPEFVEHQFGVGLHILDEQHPQRHGHALGPFLYRGLGGGVFRTSQDWLSSTSRIVAFFTLSHLFPM